MGGWLSSPAPASDWGWGSGCRRLASRTHPLLGSGYNQVWGLPGGGAVGQSGWWWPIRDWPGHEEGLQGVGWAIQSPIGVGPEVWQPEEGAARGWAAGPALVRVGESESGQYLLKDTFKNSKWEEWEQRRFGQGNK